MTPHPATAPDGGLPGEPTTGAEPAGSAPVALGAAPRRVVFDTNVLVSLYVFADSRFAPLRGKVDSGEWLALTAQPCRDEFRRVLAYPMFRLPPERQLQLLAAYDQRAVRIDGGQPGIATVGLPRCADRDDQKFLELARDGRADWLVTADKALLKLARRDRLRGLFRILTPEAALAGA